MLKKEISMGFKNGFFLLFSVALLACATEKNIPRNTKLVRINLSNEKPYCGGAAPTPDMQSPVLEYIPNYSMLLFVQNDDETRGKQIKEVSTDNMGLLTVELPIGKYQLWKPSKLLSLEDFIRTESPSLGKDYEYKSNECFLAWKETPDFTFEISSDTTINLAYHLNCYTGSHPCLKYRGPLHP